MTTRASSQNCQESPSGLTDQPDRGFAASPLMGSSRLRRVRRGVVVSYLGWAVSALSGVILVPLFVRFLGARLYGQWVLIVSLLAYLGMSNFGAWQAIPNRIGRALATGKRQELASIVATAFWSYAALTLLLAVAGGALLFGFGSHLADRGGRGFVEALILSGVLFLVAFPLRVFGAVLRGLERVDIDQSIAVFTGLLRIAAIASVLFAGLKLVGVAAVHGISLVAAGAAAYFAVRRVSPEASARPAGFSIRLLRQLARPSAAFFLLDASSLAGNATSNIVIAYFLGAVAVTRYSVPWRMLWMLAGAMAVAPSAVRPSLTIQYERRDLRVLQPAFFLSMRLSAICAMAAVIALWIGGHALIRLWAGANIFPGAAVFGLQLAFFFILVLLFPCYTVLMGATRHYGYAAVSLIEAFLDVALSVWWVKSFGLAGVIAGVLAARLLTTGWYMPFATARVLELDAKQLKREAWPILLCVAPALCASPLTVAAGGTGDVQSLWIAGLAASVYVLASALVAFDGDERSRLWRILTARAGREALA